MPKKDHLPGCCKYNLKKRHDICNEQTCRSCETCLLHAMFKANAARRVANGLKNGMLTVRADQSQIVAFNELWETWMDRWGKEKAMDAVIASMCDSEARYQDLLELVAKIKAQKRKRKHA